MAIARTIIQEKDVSEVVDEASAKYARLEEVLEAWEWRLARDPLRDAMILKSGNPGLYMVKTPDLSAYGLPKAITFLYKVTEDDVTIISIRID